MRLLLVEDDVMVASGMKLGLTDAGYTVDWVGSGERAEQALERDSFDLAIVDIGLPGLNGLELTQRLRGRGLTMPVLILTARDALHDRVQGLDLGAEDEVLGLEDALERGRDVAADGVVLRLEVEERNLRAHSARSSA